MAIPVNLHPAYINDAAVPSVLRAAAELMEHGASPWRALSVASKAHGMPDHLPDGFIDWNVFLSLEAFEVDDVTAVYLRIRAAQLAQEVAHASQASADPDGARRR